MLLQVFGAENVQQLQMRCRRARSARYCYFEDGRKATGDVLVAADGTHSMTRSYVLGHAVERRYVMSTGMAWFPQ